MDIDGSEEAGDNDDAEFGLKYWRKNRYNHKLKVTFILKKLIKSRCCVDKPPQHSAGATTNNVKNLENSCTCVFFIVFTKNQP
jgi:hypothetical protein